jgi:hypothetical protein
MVTLFTDGEVILFKPRLIYGNWPASRLGVQTESTADLRPSAMLSSGGLKQNRRWVDGTAACISGANGSRTKESKHAQIFVDS